MDEPTPKKESAAAKKEREEREKAGLREKRQRQLADATNAAEALEARLQSARSILHRCEILIDHSGGFYDEVSRLAKGRTIFEATTLVTEQANDIIRDAKEIVKGDVHLDRIKEFVPAGNNPQYPDVVVSIRSVRDSLVRGRKDLNSRLDYINGQLRKAETLIDALSYFLDENKDGEEDENYPSKEAVEAYVQGTISDSCFLEDPDSGVEYFDFGRLDQQTVLGYLSMKEKDSAEDPERGTESQEKDDESEEVQDEEEDGDE